MNLSVFSNRLLHHAFTSEREIIGGVSPAITAAVKPQLTSDSAPQEAKGTGRGINEEPDAE